MATIRIIARCDWCEEEETFDSAEDFEVADWWSVTWKDEEWIYCSRECMIANLSGADDPSPSFY